MAKMLTVKRLREKLLGRGAQEEDLESIADEVVGLWEQETGRLWDYRTAFVEFVRPRGDRETAIWPLLSPVISIAGIRERSTGSSTWTELATTGYVCSDGKRIERLGGYWADEVELTMTGGYRELEAPATPKDVLAALVTQAQFGISRFGAEKVAVQSQTFKGGSGTLLDATIHPRVKALAARYRRWN